MSQVRGHEVVPGPPAPLTAAERAELDRLREENATLRGTPTPRGHRVRSILSAVLLVLGVVLVPVSLVAVWSDRQVSDTDRFVETMSPLIADPDVQNAITNRVTATVFEYVDVQALANEAIAALAAQGLPPEVAQRLEGLTPTLASATTTFVRDKVADLVATPEFAAAWDQALRVAHQQAVAVLSGESSAVVVQGDTVYLDLAPFIDAAKQRLSAEGLTVVERIPEVHPTIALAPADTLVRAQGVYSALNAVSTVLPWITLLLLAVGVYLARRRSRALVATGLGVALALVLLAAGLLVVRSVLIGAVPPAGAPAAASGFDILVRFLRDGGRALLVLALVIALGAYLAGPSATAVGVRRWSRTQLERIRGGPDASSPVGAWVHDHVRVLRIAAVAVAVLVFVFLSQPSGVTILVIATCLLAVLGIIEFLGRRPADPPPAG